MRKMFSEVPLAAIHDDGGAVAEGNFNQQDNEGKSAQVFPDREHATGASLQDHVVEPAVVTAPVRRGPGRPRKSSNHLQPFFREVAAGTRRSQRQITQNMQKSEPEYDRIDEPLESEASEESLILSDAGDDDDEEKFEAPKATVRNGQKIGAKRGRGRLRGTRKNEVKGNKFRCGWVKCEFSSDCPLEGCDQLAEEDHEHPEEIAGSQQSTGKRKKTRSGNHTSVGCTIPGCDFQVQRGQPYRSKMAKHLRTFHGVENTDSDALLIRCDWEGCLFTCENPYAINRHKRRHTGEKPFVCTVDSCEYSAARKDNLVVHHRRLHEEPRETDLFECSEEGCGYKNARKSELLIHMRKHTGERPYACDECSFTARHRSTFRIHKQKHKDLGPGEPVKNAKRRRRKDISAGEKPFLCSIPGCEFRATASASLREHTLLVHGVSDPSMRALRCDWLGCGYMCCRPTKLETHKRTHTGEKTFICLVEGCSYAALRKDGLTRHVACVHPVDGDLGDFEMGVVSSLRKTRDKQTGVLDDATLLACDWNGCSFTTRYRKSVIEHKQSKHLGEKPYICTWLDCSYASISQKYLKRHTRIHEDPDGRPDKCKLCEKTFARRSGLIDHEKREHSVALGKTLIRKPCTFPGCSYKSHKSYALRRHMLTHGTEQERPLECDWRGCEFRTNDKSRLDKHKASHGEKKVVCQVQGCSYRTYHIDNLRAHRKVHDGKTHPCPWEGCDYKGATRMTVKRHMVLHTGEKPFVCEACDMSFGFHSSLWLHNKKVHADGAGTSDRMEVEDSSSSE